jgi:hypothetical protein
VVILIASVMAEAGEARDPRWDRAALIADDLLAKATAIRDDDGPWQAMYGYPGPAALTSPTRQHSIAGDVLERAQRSMDGDAPDVRAAAAGLAAARRLITVGAKDRGKDRALWIAYLTLGLDARRVAGSPWFEGPGDPGPGPLAPPHLIVHEAARGNA